MTRVAPAFDPYGPPDAPRRIARGLWIVDGPEIRFHYLGLAWPFPTRMTILALADGGLWLHSPVQPTGRLFAAVERLGPVRHLIAPNTLHYWWIPEWKARFPDAVVHLAPGLAARSKQPLPPGPTLSPDAPSAWRGQTAIGSAASRASYSALPMVIRRSRVAGACGAISLSRPCDAKQTRAPECSKM